MLLLAVGGWVFNAGLMLFGVICVLMVLAVMVQKPQGGGLSAAFGASSGSGQTAFGTKTGDALTVVTILVFAVWLSIAVALNIMARPGTASATPDQPQTPAQTPAQTPTSTGATPPSNPNPAPAGTPAATPASPDKPVTVPAATPEAPKPDASQTPAPANPATPPAVTPGSDPKPDAPR